MSDISGKIDSVSLISGVKSLTSAISGTTSGITPIQGTLGKSIISGLMSPYTTLSGSGAWTVPLNGKLKIDPQKAGVKGVALFHNLSGSSGDVKGSDYFLGSNNTKKA